MVDSVKMSKRDFALFFFYTDRNASTKYHLKVGLPSAQEEIQKSMKRIQMEIRPVEISIISKHEN